MWDWLYSWFAPRRSYATVAAELARAQRQGDEAAVNRLAAEAIKLLGSRAGYPDRPETYFAPSSFQRPSLDVAKAFEKHRLRLERETFWHWSGTPDRPLRDVASVVSGCLAARRAGCERADELLALAIDAAEALSLAMQQGGRGMYPFPYHPTAAGAEFEVARQFYRKAQAAGRLNDVLVNGWFVDDLGEGHLQFDNGLCGVAVAELGYETSSLDWLGDARSAAAWAAWRASVPNWNYNSFSAALLAQVAQAALPAAFRLGVRPGQIAAPHPRAGRWFDGHNARLVYHYVLCRNLVWCAAGLPRQSSERAEVVAVLRAAWRAVNPEFVQRGIAHLETPLEALALAKLRLSDEERAGCYVDEAFEVLAREAVVRFARGSLISPAPWGYLLEVLSRA